MSTHNHLENPYSSPDFSEEVCKPFLGKRLLVGITTRDHNGAALSQQQFHGIIQRVTPEGIVILRNDSGAAYSLPPDLSQLHPVPAGHYTLHTTGEVVENPDYLATWEKYPPSS